MKSSVRLNRFLPALAGLAALGSGFAFAAGSADPAGAAPFRCAVQAAPSGTATTLEAVIETDAALEGVYRFAVTSVSGGGRSQVNQGGPFVLAAGERATLGSVAIAANAQSEIVFEIEIDGETWSCAPAAA